MDLKRKQVKELVTIIVQDEIGHTSGEEIGIETTVSEIMKVFQDPEEPMWLLNKSCHDCRFHKDHEQIKGPLGEMKAWCECKLYNKPNAQDYHKWRMLYSPDGRSYKHDGDLSARYICPQFKIRMRSYAEVKNLFNLVQKAEKHLWQTTETSQLRELFGGGGPYSEGFNYGFFEALLWVLYEYNIKVVRELQEKPQKEDKIVFEARVAPKPEEPEPKTPEPEDNNDWESKESMIVMEDGSDINE